MAEIRTQIDINAPVDKVFNTILNFADYPRWNPLIPKATGSPYVGSPVTISLATPLGLNLDVDVEIQKNDRLKEFRWVGHAPLLPALFSGDHYYRFESLSEDKTRFVHGEIFEGWIEPLVGGLIEDQLTPLYVDMNMALKKFCESGR